MFPYPITSSTLIERNSVYVESIFTHSTALCQRIHYQKPRCSVRYLDIPVLPAIEYEMTLSINDFGKKITFAVDVRNVALNCHLTI